VRVVQFICGITAAGLLGSAKSYASSYNRTPQPGIGAIDFYNQGSLTSPMNYLFFVASIITILAFLRMLLHAYYVKVSIPRRSVAAADLAVVSVWFTFILAAVIVLPSKVHLFKSLRLDLAPYTAWVLKLKNARVFILLAFLLCLVTLTLSAIIVRKSERRSPATAGAHVPPPDASKDVQMGGPTYAQRVGGPAYVQRV